MSDDYGEATARSQALPGLAFLAGMALALVYMPEMLRDIPIVRALFVLVVGGLAGIIVDLLRAAFFPTSPSDRLFFALVAALLGIAWHQTLYKIGLVDTEASEHYRKLTEDR